MTNLKTAVILGAGQMGQVAAELLNCNSIRLIAFGDNNPEKWNSIEPEKEQNCDSADISGIPIVPVEKAVSLNPDIVLISTMGEDRTEALTEQVKAEGYRGSLLHLRQLHSTFDIRSRTVRHLIRRIQEKKTEGAIAELGVYRGDLARQLNLLAPDRTLYLFDTFKGFDKRDLLREESPTDRTSTFEDTSPEYVLGRMPFPDKVVLRQGYFPETAQGLEAVRYAFVSLDPDLYEPVLAGLKYFYPRLSKGGVIVLHDYNNRQFDGVRRAVADFEGEAGDLKLVPLADIHGSCVIVK